MYEKLVSYSLWGSTWNFQQRALKVSLEWIKRFMTSMNIFCWLFPKLSYMVTRMRWNFIGEHFFFYFNVKNVFVCGSSLFSDKISSGWIHKVHAVWLHMDEIKKGNAALSVWNGNILLFKRPHHTQELMRQNVWRAITGIRETLQPSTVGWFNFYICRQQPNQTKLSQTLSPT